MDHTLNPQAEACGKGTMNPSRVALARGGRANIQFFPKRCSVLIPNLLRRSSRASLPWLVLGSRSGILTPDF